MRLIIPLILFFIGCATTSPQSSSFIDVSALLSRYPRLVDSASVIEVSKVTSRLSSIAGISTPEILLLDTKDPIAASVNSRTLILSKGMILHLQSEAELAFLLAHEISHIVLKHSFATRDKERIPDEELEADSKALEILTNAGYDPRAAIGLIMREAHDSKGSLYPERVLRLRSLLVSWARAPLPGIVSTREFDEVIYRLRNSSQS